MALVFYYLGATCSTSDRTGVSPVSPGSTLNDATVGQLHRIGAGTETQTGCVIQIFGHMMEFKQQPLLELAGSIAKFGLAQPITVRPVPPELSGVRYEVVAGERKLKACILYTELMQSKEWEVSPKIEPETTTKLAPTTTRPQL